MLNRDLEKGMLEEAMVMRQIRHGQIPRWPYHTPKLGAKSVPLMWWKESHDRKKTYLQL